jgi:hypothetical protein
MNRLFGAAKKEEPAPVKKEEPAPIEMPKKVTVPLSEQQAKVNSILASWRTKCASFPRR